MNHIVPELVELFTSLKISLSLTRIKKTINALDNNFIFQII